MWAWHWNITTPRTHKKNTTHSLCSGTRLRKWYIYIWENWEGFFGHPPRGSWGSERNKTKTGCILLRLGATLLKWAVAPNRIRLGSFWAQHKRHLGPAEMQLSVNHRTSLEAHLHEKKSQLYRTCCVSGTHLKRESTTAIARKSDDTNTRFHMLAVIISGWSVVTQSPKVGADRRRRIIDRRVGEEGHKNTTTQLEANQDERRKRRDKNKQTHNVHKHKLNVNAP